MTNLDLLASRFMKSLAPSDAREFIAAAEGKTLTAFQVATLVKAHDWAGPSKVPNGSRDCLR